MAISSIDSLDRKILKVLCTDGRISIVDLAERVGLSPTPCRRRVTRLEDEGVIAAYRAQIDHRAAGLGITAYVSVELERQSEKEITAFQKRIAHFDEVVTASLMTGSQDFLLEVVVETLEAYERFHQSKLMSIAGIRAVRTRFALKRFLDRARLP